MRRWACCDASGSLDEVLLACWPRKSKKPKARAPAPVVSFLPPPRQGPLSTPPFFQITLLLFFLHTLLQTKQV